MASDLSSLPVPPESDAGPVGGMTLAPDAIPLITLTTTPKVTKRARESDEEEERAASGDGDADGALVDTRPRKKFRLPDICRLVAPVFAPLGEIIAQRKEGIIGSGLSSGGAATDPMELSSDDDDAAAVAPSSANKTKRVADDDDEEEEEDDDEPSAVTREKKAGGGGGDADEDEEYKPDEKEIASLLEEEAKAHKEALAAAAAKGDKHQPLAELPDDEDKDAAAAADEPSSVGDEVYLDPSKPLPEPAEGEEDSEEKEESYDDDPDEITPPGEIGGGGGGGAGDDSTVFGVRVTSINLRTTPKRHELETILLQLPQRAYSGGGSSSSSNAAKRDAPDAVINGTLAVLHGLPVPPQDRKRLHPLLKKWDAKRDGPKIETTIVISGEGYDGFKNGLFVFSPTALAD